MTVSVSRETFIWKREFRFIKSLAFNKPLLDISRERLQSESTA